MWPLLARAVHVLRLIAAALLAGIIAGAVAGLGSRLAMFLVRLMNPSHNGEVTHANAAVGRITADGTLALIMEGMFYGIPGSVVYLIVRRWIPWDGLLKGLAFGCVLLIVAGSAVIDGNYEYFRYVSTWVSVGLFALLYPLYGLVLVPLTERLGRGAKGPPRNAVVACSGYLILGGILLWSLDRDYTALRDVFGVLQ